MARQGDSVEAMSALDVLMYRGDDFPRALSVVGGLYLLDGTPQPRRVLQSLERACGEFPRLRQKVLVAPLPVVLPRWVVAADFDLADHVRRVQVPPPGSLREVLDVVRPELSAPLDSDRPLWEAILLEGLEDGRSALFFRMGHAVTDGMGAMRLFDSMFDPSARPRRPSRGSGVAAVSLTPAELQARALARLPGEIMTGTLQRLPGMVNAARSALQDPMGFARSIEGYAASARRILGLPCPSAPALAGRSVARRCAVLSVPLRRLKPAARHLHASVNDLYLAAIAAALRRYQAQAGADPVDTPLAVPVNLRRGDEAAAGNHIGAVAIALPCAEPDAGRRLELIRAAIRAGRDEPAIGAHALFAAAVARVPDVALERLLSAVPRADVQASNVVGPVERPFFAGRRVLAAYPFGPVPGVGAMIAMLSVADECNVAAHFDPAAFEDAEGFAECLRQGFAEVLEAGGQSGHIGAPVLDHAPESARPKRRVRRN